MVEKVPRHRHTLDEVIGTVGQVYEPTGTRRDLKKVDLMIGPDGDYPTIDKGIQMLSADGGSLGLTSNFSINSTIIVNKPSVMILGNGREKTKIAMSGNAPAFQFEQSRGILSDLTIEGPGSILTNTSSVGVKVMGTGFRAENLNIDKAYNAIEIYNSAGSWNEHFANIFIGTGAGLGCGRSIYAHSPRVSPTVGGDNFTAYHVWGDNWVDLGLTDYALVEIDYQNAPRLLECDLVGVPKDGLWVKRNQPGWMSVIGCAFDNCGRYAVRLEDTAGVPETLIQVEFSNCWLKTTSTTVEAVRIKKAQRIQFRGGQILGSKACHNIINSADIILDALNLANVDGITQANADGIIIDNSQYVRVGGQIAAVNAINRGLAEINGAANNFLFPMLSGTMTTKISKLAANNTVCLYAEGGALTLEPGTVIKDSLWANAVKPRSNLSGGVGASAEKWLESYIQSMWTKDVKPYGTGVGVVGDASYPFADGRFNLMTIGDLKIVTKLDSDGTIRAIGFVGTKSGAGAPSGGLDGDIYVDTTNGRFYFKSGGVWRYIIPDG